MVEREHSGKSRLNRPLSIAAAALAAASMLALSACTEAENTSAGEVASPAPQSTGTPGSDLPSVLPEGKTLQPEGGTANAAAGNPAKGDGKQWGSYKSATEACAALAGGVAVITLAPLNLFSGVDEKQLQDLEAEVRGLAKDAPAELREPLGEVRAEIGKHDKLEEFDYEAFQDALEPLDDWLDTHCDF
ncbi:hypothetical protein [Arthrobacter sp. USHLN218]|uniref:hypothetical protein n=1 Tax=Arthrobacter sp. USHLN218 TaxID=3081232 RepID=UPI00301A3451